MKNIFTTTAILALLLTGTVLAQEKSSPSNDHCAMMQRGDQEMGFSHEKTTHHFLLFKDGGAITVTANDAKDTASRDQIRQHLSHIAKMFTAGNFNVPMLIHGVTPPGVPAMTELREQISYTFQEISSGARVRIKTTDPRALEAVYSFLRFQIKEHETGDPAGVSDDTRVE